MILALASSSLSWGWPVAASIGGIAVFIGLLLEKIAELKNEKYSPPFFKPYKLLSECGWIFLMAGITAEIIVGFALAAKDEKVERQTASDIAKNDPLKKLIASANADVSFIIGDTNDWHSADSRFKLFVSNKEMLVPSPIAGWDTKKISLKLWNKGNLKNPVPINLRCVSLEQTDAEVINGHVGYVMTANFVLNSSEKMALHSLAVETFPPGTPIPSTDFSVGDFDTNGALVIETPPIPDGFEIRKGDCALSINSLKLDFSFPEHSRGGSTELHKTPQ